MSVSSQVVGLAALRLTNCIKVKMLKETTRVSTPKYLCKAKLHGITHNTYGGKALQSTTLFMIPHDQLNCISQGKVVNSKPSEL